MTTEARASLPALVSVAEAARILGIKPDTCRDLAARGQLPGVLRVGGRWYLSRRALAVWLANAGTLPEGDTR